MQNKENLPNIHPNIPLHIPQNILLPKAFVAALEKDWPHNVDALLESLHKEAHIALRLHTLKEPNELLFATEEIVPWCPEGRYLKQRPSFTLDPLWHAGAYYVQEASSMFIDHLLKKITLPEAPVCLDLCAAPGGKTTLLLTHLNHKGMLVANEVIKSRNEILIENLIKWGYANFITTQSDAALWGRSTGLFDLILVDAPCSGEGLFRKDRESIQEWSLDNVALCEVRQSKILENITPCLKEGGFLIYATCTYNKQENDEQVEKLLEKGIYEKVSIALPEAWGIQKTKHGFQCLPSHLQGEGFYCSLLQKTAQEHVTSSQKSTVLSIPNKDRMNRFEAFFGQGNPQEIDPNIPQNLSKKLSQNLSPNLSQTTQQNLYQVLHQNLYIYQDIFIHLRAQGVEVLKAFNSSIHVTHVGQHWGTDLKKEVVPEHGSLMDLSSPFHLPKIEVNKSQALDFLRKQPFATNENLHGWHAVYYQGLPLGWIKCLGNRSNNYYPKHWRIKNL